MSCCRTPKYIRYLSIGGYLDRNAQHAAIRQRKQAVFASSISASADDALEAIAPAVQSGGFMAFGAGADSRLEMLGGPEETLG